MVHNMILAVFKQYSYSPALKFKTESVMRATPRDPVVLINPKHPAPEVLLCQVRNKKAVPQPRATIKDECCVPLQYM